MQHILRGDFFSLQSCLDLKTISTLIKIIKFLELDNCGPARDQIDGFELLFDFDKLRLEKVQELVIRIKSNQVSDWLLISCYS
jgi:hypothetical protein